MITMKSTKPYLLKAFRDWLIDSQLTPMIYVKTDILGVQVPQKYIVNNHIMLNVSAEATDQFEQDEYKVTFLAEFDEGVEQLRIPMVSIVGIVASEIEWEWVFADEDPQDDDPHEKAKGVPDLKVL